HHHAEARGRSARLEGQPRVRVGVVGAPGRTHLRQGEPDAAAPNLEAAAADADRVAVAALGGPDLEVGARPAAAVVEHEPAALAPLGAEDLIVAVVEVVDEARRTALIAAQRGVARGALEGIRQLAV